MIKSSTYIRKFTEKQIKQMEQVKATNKKLKTVPDILFFALDNFTDLQKDNERLKRLIDFKQKKINNLTAGTDANI